MQVDDLKLDYCVKCSDCNAACSVSKVYPDYPGPKALGPDMERFRREGVASDTKWVEYCLGCHRCDLACPHGVNVSELIAKGKAEHEKVGLRGLRDRLLARPSVLGKLGSSTAPVSNAILGLKLNRWLMSSLVEITAKRSFPAYSSKPIQPANGDQTAGPKVVFFPGCFIRYNNPEVGRMVVDLLRLNGFAVEVSAARCCGMPAMANGEKAELMSAVEENVVEMVRAVDQGACIVTACTSCGYALKGDYSHLLEGNSAHAESAQKVSSATFDLAELLTGLLDEGKLNTSFRPLNLKLAYHAPCHLKSQGIGRSVAALAARGAGNRNRGNQGRLLWDGGDVWLQEREVSHLHGYWPRSLRGHPGLQPTIGDHRMRQLPDADRAWHSTPSLASGGNLARRLSTYRVTSGKII